MEILIDDCRERLGGIVVATFTGLFNYTSTRWSLENSHLALVATCKTLAACQSNFTTQRHRVADGGKFAVFALIGGFDLFPPITDSCVSITAVLDAIRAAASMTATRVLSRCTDRKLRLLCLHGMYQDAATFSAKTKPLRGATTSADMDFVFLDGPFTIVPPILARQSKRPSGSNAASSKPKRVRCAKKKTEFRAWWRPLGIHQEDPRNLDGDRDVLVHFLREKLDKIGDVDGVVGFSQGASLAAWMCSQQARAELQWSPKLAVLVGSYLGSPQYSLDSGVLPDIASLHMFGSNDYVIPAAKSQQVVDIFKQEETIENRVLTSVHSQGHVIPKCDASKEIFKSFLAQQQLRLLGSPSTSSSTSEREELPPSEALASQRACVL